MKTKPNKLLHFPNIGEFFKEHLPEGYVNDCSGWGYSRDDVVEAGQKGLLLTMDIETTGSTACSLYCPHCFRKGKVSDRQLLSFNELEGAILDAKKLGLKSVKIIGCGEPLEDRTLLSQISMLRDNDIKVCIFTKGHVIGSEDLSFKYFNISREQLAQDLFDYNVTLLFSINSFNPLIQDQIVGVDGFSEVRNRAIEICCKVGFNAYSTHTPTRLAFVMTPLTHYNKDEACEVYRWAHFRNIHIVTTPTMVSGMGKSRLSELKLNDKELLEIYVRLNEIGVSIGAVKPDDIKLDGCSAYAGGAPCNQAAVGMYLRNDGILLRCPGDDVTYLGNIRDESLESIWHRSDNYRIYRGKHNNRCPPKEGPVFPAGFFDTLDTEIITRLFSG
ncbi:hypothetical protein ES703_67079 [subsurface metagenome]